MCIFNISITILQFGAIMKMLECKSCYLVKELHNTTIRVINTLSLVILVTIQLDRNYGTNNSQHPESSKS